MRRYLAFMSFMVFVVVALASASPSTDPLPGEIGAQNLNFLVTSSDINSGEEQNEAFSMNDLREVVDRNLEEIILESPAPSGSGSSALNQQLWSNFLADGQVATNADHWIVQQEKYMDFVSYNIRNLDSLANANDIFSILVPQEDLFARPIGA